jgi:GGDEF domain-containing protein
MPGTTEIEREIRRHLETGEEFAVCYADLDHFKEQRSLLLL